MSVWELAMVLLRAARRWVIAGLAVALIHGATVSQAQTAGEKKLQFEVASVRQNRSNDKSSSNISLDNGYLFTTLSKADTYIPPGGLLSASNVSLTTYICFAYKLSATQYLALRAWQLQFNDFVGSSTSLPKWVIDDRFDIQARAAGNPTRDEMRLMMQALLADRFGLVVHKETREVPVFAMVLVKPGKLGPGLRPHPVTDTCSSDTQVEGYPPVCGVIARLAASSPGRSSFGGRSITMEALASSLPTETGLATLPRPVIDETGMHGTYDFVMEWVQMTQDGTVPEGGGPSFEGALKEQLGLRLESKKGPVEVLVIDRVEHPSAN
jgi:uncharacterized protein (TIGR03435 family)